MPTVYRYLHFHSPAVHTVGFFYGRIRVGVIVAVAVAVNTASTAIVAGHDGAHSNARTTA